MPTISTATLSLTDIGVGIVVQVRYTATFNRFDRQLSALGKTWHSHVTIHDFDGGADSGDVILDFGAPDDRERFAVTVGTTPGPSFTGPFLAEARRQVDELFGAHTVTADFRQEIVDFFLAHP